MGSSWSRAGAIAALSAACACGAAFAQQAGATQQMQVSARVQEHARLRVLSQPEFFEVSEADVARGYVDVPTPLRVEVVSNLPRGVQLSFTPLDAQVRDAQAFAAPRAARRAGGGLQRELMEMHLRLALAAGARAGRHAWPVQVSLAPL